ncbi:hypothetical protein B0H11DRAFT_1899798 [Mycena galericulata]|nr:hypothetical protein B0H11DRAFT_1899798 [Mycena galericulata]
MAIPATPGLLQDLQVLNLVDDSIPNLLGKFEAWDNAQPAPLMKSLSNITQADLTALGPFVVHYVPTGCFRGTQPNHATNIIQAILQSQPQSRQQLDVSDNFLQGVQTSLLNAKVHSLTFNKSEMTRRTVVDTILSAAVSLAQTAWDFAILNAEEHNFSTVSNKGVTFTVNNQDYLLSGPIDYVVTGLNSKLVAQNLVLFKLPNVQLLPSQVQGAIKGTGHTICPIEAKVSISGNKRYQALLQVIGESLVLCKARYKNLTSPLPFILSDGENWIFGILSNKEIFIADLTWGTGHDEKDILRALVIWTCSQPQKIWTEMGNALTPATRPLYGEDFI